PPGEGASLSHPRTGSVTAVGQRTSPTGPLRGLLRFVVSPPVSRQPDRGLRASPRTPSAPPRGLGEGSLAHTVRSCTCAASSTHRRCGTERQTPCGPWVSPLPRSRDKRRPSTRRLI